MRSETLRDQIQRTPFRPVTLFLPSGKSVTVSNPEFAMFNETGRTLAIFQGARLLLIDVATVEAVGDSGKLSGKARDRLQLVGRC